LESTCRLNKDDIEYCAIIQNKGKRRKLSIVLTEEPYHLENLGIPDVVYDLFAGYYGYHHCWAFQDRIEICRRTQTKEEIEEDFIASINWRPDSDFCALHRCIPSRPSRRNILPTGRPPVPIEISRLDVTCAFRHSMIATRLLHDAVKWIRNRDLSAQVCLFDESELQDARNIYQQSGFKPCCRAKCISTKKIGMASHILICPVTRLKSKGYESNESGYYSLRNDKRRSSQISVKKLVHC
jgi:predicted GNAT family N-acyltransferase